MHIGYRDPLCPSLHPLSGEEREEAQPMDRSIAECSLYESRTKSNVGIEEE